MTSALTFVLIHSPLVGALTWEPVADLLRSSGVGVVVPSLAGIIEADPPYYPKLTDRVVDAARAAGAGQELALIGHSGAGALLPSVAIACGDQVRAIIFVDAILPHPGASWFDTAPPQPPEQLRALAVAGRLPPWDQWFPPGTIEALLPDPGLHQRFVAEQPRASVRYFEELAPFTNTPSCPAGYLQLSTAYQQVAHEAERRGWPTIRLTADHLAMLTLPELIVSSLLRLFALAIGTP